MFPGKIKKWIGTFLSSVVRRKSLASLEGKIQSIIDAGEEDGLIDRQSGEMIQSIFEFRETVAREVMIPRTEIVAVSDNSTIDDILTLTLKHGHTRMPFYIENIDNIVGILNVKDLLRFWSKPFQEEDIISILRKTYYIPETKNIHLLLHELKEKKSHMAIVIDEYGGTSGLVTLEDLIEEIVGEIKDEHDIEENPFTKLHDGDILVDSRVEIEDFEEYFGLKVPEGQFETLGGFIFYLIKKIPVVGETVTYKNLKITIEAADERSIKKVRIRGTGETILPVGNKKEKTLENDE
ncbi:MAG: HlyC/CorC family transporter [Syntrophobacterales bacterium]|nr:HlyC/CorC family transporter [Syntrophobacterales bacterium]